MENISFVHRAQFGFGTPVYCLICDERVHQLKSPLMYNRILQQMGLNGACVPFKVDPQNLGQALESLRILNLSGANITVPYQEKASQFMDILSESAQIIGAINTVVCKAGKLKGYNTNAIGFMDALSAADFDVAGKNAAIFGTGGAAKAVAFIFNWLQADHVTIVGRDKDRTWSLANNVSGSGILLENMNSTSIEADIVVNATAVSSPEECHQMADIVAQLKLTNCRLVYDLNYGRRTNFWQQRAKALSATFKDGLTVLANQARRTFSLWTGMDVPPGTFLDALK